MIKDFSTVFWGYLPPTREPYEVHQKVNAFIGPSGHGKTTIWDGLRLMLGAGHFESKRTFAFYVHKKSNWAVVKVSFYNLAVNGVRPFEFARKFEDEVTACCRIYKNNIGSWSREYYLFDGKFNDLNNIQFNAKAYSQAVLTVGQYLEILERCLGITKEFRNLMAMSPDTVREVVNSSPRALFDLVFSLKGVKDYKERYDDSKQRLNEHEILIENTEREWKQAKDRLEEINKKVEKFRLYQIKEKEVNDTSIKVKKIKYIEAKENLEDKEIRISEVEKEIKEERSKFNKLGLEIDIKQKEINNIKDKYDYITNDINNLDKKIKEYINEKSEKFTEAQALFKEITILKEIEPQNIDDLKKSKDIFEEDIKKKNLEFVLLEEELNKLNQKISELKMNIAPYKNEAKIFRKILEEKNISFLMLSDTISIKPEVSKWQKSVEAYLGNNRFRIIVEESDYLAAKKLQENEGYGARVSLPRNREAIVYEKDIEYPTIRSVINVINEEKVEGYLNKLNQVYLVETVEEGHNLQKLGIESITLEGLLQDNDGAIHLKYYQLCCGKLALDEEKKHTEELLALKTKTFEKLKKNLLKLKSNCNQLEINIQNQNKLINLSAIEKEYEKLLNKSEKLYICIKKAENQKKEYNKKRYDIHKEEVKLVEKRAIFKEQQSQASKKVIDLSNLYKDLQKDVDYLKSLFKQTLEEVKALVLTDDDIDFISYEIQGKGFTDGQGKRLSLIYLENELRELISKKEELYDPSMNEDRDSLLEVHKGQVKILGQNLQSLKKDRDNLERTCNDLLFQFRGHIKEIVKDYISEFEFFADLLKALGKGKLIEVTPEPETWEIQLYIGYDGKDPVPVDGPHLSSGQKASTSLMILLAALSDSKKGTTTPIMFLDEPKARVDDERGNEIGQLLQVTDIQYFITHQQGESLKTIDWIDHAFTCSACEKGKDYAKQLILKRRARR